MTDPLDFPDGAVAEDDLTVVAGMERLQVLLAAKDGVADLVKPPA